MYVVGAVKHPGVYTLPANARVYQLLQAAGGPLPDANLVALNMAAKLNDGQEVYVAVIGETPPATGGVSAPVTGTSTSGTLININTASVEQMRLALHVSSKTAQKIIDYRLEHSLSCSDLLIASVLLPRVEPSITLIDFIHERALKNTPWKLPAGIYLVPDGWVHLRYKNKSIGICFEVDRNTEDRDKIQQKVRNYCTFTSGIHQQMYGLEKLIIAFCVTDGGQKRVQQLLTWAEQTGTHKRNTPARFLFGSVLPEDIDPLRFFFDATFLTPFETTPTALVETL